MEEKIEDIVKVSPKGQIVIPKTIRKKLGIIPGEKLLVASRDKEIHLKKLKGVSIEEISERIEQVARRKGIDLDRIISEAIEWARKSK
ncbi:MAG: AbrB/MazE/SpoVT family DNA-binding domain-containing protein [Candidatus Aenigmarchaeota archaeon]|nr:AbrB/MazE/SpoVT family DNA-binding domain-containing protein [Candidatus Aenigmarchaeota archaeon]